MSTQDTSRAAAAIELADAILAEFNDPNSKLKGIGTVSMEKLLAYDKITQRSQRAKAKRSTDADPAT